MRQYTYTWITHLIATIDKKNKYDNEKGKSFHRVYFTEYQELLMRYFSEANRENLWCGLLTSNQQSRGIPIPERKNTV